ncbi:MAG: glycoside hydrolase family 92 protein [Deltaproteobacteria bacterium]|nr:glycoside hydrolase family 92 protein [Deltaproteobacteria bacterium]
MMYKSPNKLGLATAGLVAAMGAAQLGSCAFAADSHHLASYVDPFIGTGPSNAPNPVPGGTGGSVFPGATVPFGMVQFSPDTPAGEPSGYGYNDHEITGFSLTHFSGAGCRNFADLPMTPTVGVGNSEFKVGFSHANETAHAGYYRVTLDNGVRSELTATTRTGAARFTFPTGSTANNLLIDIWRSAAGVRDAAVNAVGPRTLEGYVASGNFCNTNNKYTLYFTAEFSQPFALSTTSSRGALLTFADQGDQAVEMRIGLSYVSIGNARDNLAAENPTHDFDKVRGEAEATWDKYLSRVEMSGDNKAQLTKFYTALYHSFLHPNVYSDINGDYRGFDDQIHKASGYTQYANYSGWDIYRSQVQLLAWLLPKEASDMAQSLVAAADECGALPKWSQANGETGVMVGDPGALIVANIYAFGGKEFDTSKALAHMVRTGTEPGTACNGVVIRPGLKDYLEYGYIPYGAENIWGSVSTTLEYQNADYAVALFAKAIGDDKTSDRFMNQAMLWTRQYDASTNLLRPRKADGTWQGTGFGPSATDGFVEGNAEQYVWMVPYDPSNLVSTLGGAEAVRSRLDKLFSRLNAGLSDPYFYMGNEPNFATPWLYAWAGAPWRTQDVVRRIMDEAFGTDAGGLPGNDDLGATSSWYVWSALGLYPITPGGNGLVIGSPSFAEAKVTLGNGKQLVIKGQGAPQRYVQTLRINGQTQAPTWTTADQLNEGGVMQFELGAEPLMNH